ncbi:MAG: NAD(P)/FAD-dependent oxidoreductase [Candidatus Heimdallarchaeota archaeon]|nr:NAD(P)/FAD-dependent oxidoreductase [Candidatus Heimdallarchaeota archaeon]
MSFDVIVVGAGPAGVITAITLATKQVRVLLVDRKPIDQIGKKACGDALDLKAVKFLQEKLSISPPAGEEIADHLVNGVFVAGDKEIVRPLPGFTVNRREYGQRLLSHCLSLGVKLIDRTSVKQPILEDNYVRGIFCIQEGKEKRYYAKVIVDASGTQAAIRTKLPDEFSLGLRNKIPDTHITAAYREIWEMNTPHKFKEEYRMIYEKDMEIFPGYLWIFSKGEKRLNVGTGWMKSQHTSKSMKEIFKDTIAKYFLDEEYIILEQGGGLITMRPTFDCSTFNGGICVGDAGATTDPLTAEGHGPALLAGYYAGSAIAKVIHLMKISREDLWEYNVKLQLEIGAESAVSYAITRFLENIGEAGFRFIFSRDLLSKNDLEIILAGDEIKVTPFSIIRKIILSFPRFDLLFKLYKLSTKLDKLKKIYSDYPKDPENLVNWIQRRDQIMQIM